MLTSILTIKLFSQQFALPNYATDGTFDKFVFRGIHPKVTSGFDPGLDTLAPSLEIFISFGKKVPNLDAGIKLSDICEIALLPSDPSSGLFY